VTGPAVSAADGRARRLAAFDEPVTSVRFVDGPRADALAKLGVRTVGGLLRHYPHRWLDLRETAPLGALPIGFEVTAVGTVHEVIVKRPKPRLTITEVAIVDDTGVLIGVWFNQPYLQQRFKAGDRVAFAGKVQIEFGLRQMRTPFVERLGSSEEASVLARILPVHPATEGLSSNWMRRLVLEALDQFGDVPDPLPAELRSRRDLVPLAFALRAIHFPADTEARDTARRRLAYEELLAIQLGMALRRHTIVDEHAGHPHVVDGPHRAALASVLPFALTGDQVAATAEVLADMAGPRPMNRMLLGDVGSGKTVVAAAALSCVADSGTQAAMMAPTEVLARQYARAVGGLLDAAGVTWRLLTGSTPAPERRSILQGVAAGEVSVLLGTHALLTESVAFANLTLAVVDEQHRFGVTQRLGLRGKGEAVDMLVMTATPIPRSLALTLYGDLDTSYLREKPGGRGPEHVTTRLVPRPARAEAYEIVRAAVGAGRQAYVVCALVDESDTTEAKAAVKEAERLQKKVFPELRVGLLTGQMRSPDKIAAMEAFRAGETDVLVATTVIEVGVDVPNATVMIVEDADRFGLAQLHQLRGRIGRGEYTGQLLLFADAKTTEGKQRMKAFVSTSDGFELAEQDLRLRGEGQLLGERQHGLPELRLASIITDTDLLDAAREDARAMVASDQHLSSPEHAALLEAVKRGFGRDWEWVSSG
jgi:ATP-dependent DNA helicase RecG